MATDKNKKRSSGRKLIIIIIVLLLLGALGGAAGIYLGFSQHYKDKFFKGTVINGIDCSSRTVAEVEEMLRASAEDYALSVRFRDGSTEVLRRSDIGYRYVSDGSVQRLMNEQDPYAWIREIFPGEDKEQAAYEVPVETTFDEELTRTSLYALPEMTEDRMQAPVDAALVFEDGAFQVSKEVEGNTIDRGKVLDVVLDAIREKEALVDVTSIPGSYLSPAVRSDDPELNEKADSLNSIISASITYHMPGGDQVLDGETLLGWLSTDEEGNYYKDDNVWKDHINTYVDEMVAKVGKVGEERVFAATDIGDVRVSGGDYGWEIDAEAEKAQLTRELNESATVDREPVFASRGFSYENNGLGKTYIEVDLSRQHLWFYQDGNIIFDTDVVTGTMSEKYWTPPGIFMVKAMQRNVVLRGNPLPGGGYEYESPVSYWMPFNRDIGMHDATWRGVFGEEIYIWSGSHGCVNLPLSAAETIFNNITYETPIICYYSQDYELH